MAHHRSVQFTRPAREGSIAPDLQFQFRLAAVACGLGEIAWQGTFRHITLEMLEDWSALR